MMYARTPLLFTAAMLLSATSHAHFIWLEIAPDSPGVVQLRFAEEPLEATPRDMQEKAAGMRVSVPGGSPIALAYGDAFMSGPAAADAPSIIGTFDYGVLDRSEGGRGKFMLKYHARAARDAKAAAVAVGLPVDVTAAIDGGNMTVTVSLDGKPVAGAELVLVLPQELKPVEAKTDAAGQARVTVKTGDWVGIRAMVPEEKSGDDKGSAYSLIRHYSTLTFFHGGK